MERSYILLLLHVRSLFLNWTFFLVVFHIFDMHLFFSFRQEPDAGAAAAAEPDQPFDGSGSESRRGEEEEEEERQHQALSILLIA